MLPLIGVLLFIAISLLFISLKIPQAKLKNLAQGLLISYLTILVLFAIGEGYFRFFYAESTAYYSLSHRNWLERYWQNNSLGYRDREWLSADFEGREVITVIGDSFTAGTGINQPSDRYTDVLAARLGADYALVNLGIAGSATPTQLEALQNFTLATPNIVIWQYFLNDIEYAALRVGALPDVAVPPLVARESYLLNFLYYMITPPLGDYWGWQYSQYDNYVVWDLHQAEIVALTDYVDSINAELIVLIYPNMLDPVGSIPYVDRVAQAIEATGHTQIMKLFDDVAAWSEDVPLIVSNFDSHPSVEFNAHVAERLYQDYFANR